MTLDSMIVAGLVLCACIGCAVSATSRAVLGCGTHDLSEGCYDIESPNYPSNYPNNVDCSYQLNPPAGGSVRLSCSDFQLQNHQQCRRDFVSVDGAKYCGVNEPSGVYSSLSFRFKSNSKGVRRGYSCQLTVSTLPPPLDCSSYSLDDGEYLIESPEYPSNYGNNEDCNYYLTTANGAGTIDIQCSDFNLQTHRTCSKDYLRVNGDKYCGALAPSVSSVELDISFHSNGWTTRSGYSCKITVTGASGGSSSGGSGGGGGQGSGGGGQGSGGGGQGSGGGGQGSGGGGQGSGGGGGGSGSCCCGIPNRSSRIVGGSQTEMYEYPWQAGLVSVGETRTWCGGTVINDRYVLTAAHCTTRGASSIEVLVREHRISNPDGEQRFQVAQVIDHPSYVSASSSGYDFSLLKLSTQITFPADNSLAPACLPTAVNSDFAGADAVVTGWGTTSSEDSQATTLREVTVPVVTNSACRNAYSSINPSMICAGFSQGGKDSCQGDSGGPMVTLEGDRYSLIGVVSWGIGCALAGYPGVYARVTEVIGWIQSTTTDAVYCQ